MGKNTLTDFPQAIEEGDYSVGLEYGIVRLPWLSENGSSCLFLAFWVIPKVKKLGVYPEKHLWNGVICFDDDFLCNAAWSGGLAFDFG